MEFDEYDYLEKTVENPETPKFKERSNGGEKAGKPEDKDRRSKHKTDKNDDERHSKRTKSGDEARDHETEKGPSRHRSSPGDGDMSDRDRHRSTREHIEKVRERDKSKDKDREERNGKDRDRDKDRGVDRERGRGRDKGEHGREYENERGKEKDREVLSRSRSERHLEEKDREKGRDMEKSRDREQRDKERERVKEREVRETDRETRCARAIQRWSFWLLSQTLRDSGHGFKYSFLDSSESMRHKDKKEEVAEPVVDPERDQRTVFAYQISLKADERDVYEFFSRAGKVRDVRLIMDRNSRRSKGVGYIEFYESLSVPMAIALSGQLLFGQPVMVKPSEAEKNLVQSTASAAGVGGGLIGPYSGGARRLYVGNLHYNIKEDQLRQLFEPFGIVELVQLPSDPDTGHCKGYGFIQFARLEDARAAQSLNGQLEIAGRAIKVSAITDQAGMQDIGVNPGDFDDDEGGGMSLNARSRALLMQKLDRSGTTSGIVGSIGTPSVNSPGLAVPTAPILSATPGVSPIVAPLLHTIPALASLPAAALSVPTITVPSVESIGIPSECLLLKNMFDPKLEEEVNFDLDIKDDVQDECSKYGALKHIYVEKNSAGFVYLRFENSQSAVAAQHALHGRWFAGKMITATFMLPGNYEAKFPDSS